MEIPKQNFFKRTLASLITSFSLKFSSPTIETKEGASYYLTPESKVNLGDPVTQNIVHTDDQKQNELEVIEQAPEIIENVEKNEFEEIYDTNERKFVFLFSSLVENSGLFGTEKEVYGRSDENEIPGKSFIRYISEIVEIPEKQRLITAIEILKQATIFQRDNLSQFDIYHDEGRSVFFKDRGFLLKPEFCKTCIVKALEQSSKICKAEEVYESKKEIPTVGSELEIPKYFFYNSEGISPQQKNRYKFLSAEKYHYISVLQGFLNGMGVFTYSDDGAYEIVSPPFYSAVGLSSFQSTIRELVEHVIDQRLKEPKALTSEDAPELPLHLNYAINLGGIDIESVNVEDITLLSILSSAFSSEARIEKQEYNINSKGPVEIFNFDGKLKTTSKPASTRLEIRVHEYNGNNLAMITRVGQNMAAAFECANRLKAGQQLTENQRVLAFSWLTLKKIISKDVFDEFFPTLSNEENYTDDFYRLYKTLSFMTKEFGDNTPEIEVKKTLFNKLRKIALDYINQIEREIIFKK